MTDIARRVPVQSGSVEPPSDLSLRAGTSDLEELAAAYGIESSFVDAHGNLKQAADTTKRRLLTAMGIAAESDEDVRTSRRALEAAVWDRALPPVLVSNPATIAVPVVLPPNAGRVAWTLTCEDGTVLRGDAEVARCALEQTGTFEGRPLERRTVTVSADVPFGYHSFAIDGGEVDMRLIVTPGACWLPPAVVAGERLSGIAVQLYLLRSASNWGIGDFTDLRAVAAQVAAGGGDVVGLNPLHALFSDDPEHASPYSPESRLLLNILNIDVTAIPEFADSAGVCDRMAEADFAPALAACRAAQLIDYSTVARLKLDVLRVLFAEFIDSAATQRRTAFERFRDGAPAALRTTFVFAALRDFFAARDNERAAWQRWPAEYHDPASPAVARFTRERARDIDFVAWTQWIADDQLALAARAAATMRVGLYRDLAVGADPSGGETWCNARAVVDAARVGAPPDIYNPQGQNWDLPPFDPHALREEAYASFVELVRANMRHAGGLRIDHVMALQHIYWIPRDASPADGAYVAYPLDDLVGIIALESHRAKCLVVGEDLGTVPEGFRERMAAANILSYRVLFFERDESGAFCAPAVYPRASLAVLGSHDLPTLRAWWNGSDIRLRQRLGLFPDEAVVEKQLQSRANERDAFVRALHAAGVLGEAQAVHGDALFTAAHAFLAQTSAALAVAQLDDIADETDPVNVPTTSDEHPNWRRRISVTVEELETDPRFTAWFALVGAAGRLREDSPHAGYPSV